MSSFFFSRVGVGGGVFFLKKKKGGGLMVNFPDP